MCRNQKNSFFTFQTPAMVSKSNLQNHQGKLCNCNKLSHFSEFNALVRQHFSIKTDIRENSSYRVSRLHFYKTFERERKDDC